MAKNILSKPSVTDLLQELKGFETYTVSNISFQLQQIPLTKETGKCTLSVYSTTLLIVDVSKLVAFTEHAFDSAEAISQRFLTALKREGLDLNFLKYVLLVSAYNTYSNLGCHHSAYTILTKRNPKLFKTGCLAHLSITLSRQDYVNLTLMLML